MALNDDQQVAVFIDYENIDISCREKLGSDVDVDWSVVLETAVDFGRVVLRRAYADWAVYNANRRELLGLGIDLIYVSSKRGKNAADIKIVIDAMEMLMGESTNISHVILVSGDGDFTELVHHLRARGKFVIGLGVSGASAEYLINACDQFVFYDALVEAPAKPEKKAKKSTAASFDITEARQLLRRALRSQEDEWVSGGQLKYAMLRLNPAFSERNYGFSSFKQFLLAQKDLVQVRIAQPGGHLDVKMVTENETSTAQVAPEALLDRYLKYLSQQRVHMTPNEYRPRIVLKLYDILRTQPGRSLTEHKEDLHAHFEETAPDIKWQYVHEVIHQLFRTYCFEFDEDDSNYPADVRLWDRRVSLVEGIERDTDLLDQCDRGLLQRIGRRLGAVGNIDPEVAARLLYGSLKGQKMLDHVQHLIDAEIEAEAKSGD